jgi:hypothetical protein
VSRFSDEERQAIMRQARETVAQRETERALQLPRPRVRETGDWRLPEPPTPDDPPPGLDIRAAPVAPVVDWSARVDRKIADALGTMQGRLMSALRVVAEEVAAGHQGHRGRHGRRRAVAADRTGAALCFRR